MDKAGNTLEALLQAIERQGEEMEKQAEEKPVEQPTEKPTEVDPLEKFAAEMDDAGRVMARSFANELQKLAVGVVGVTPNTDAIPDNPAVQVSNDDVRREDADRVAAIIAQLTLGERAKGPQGYTQVDSNPVDGAASVAVDEHPTAHDVANVAKRQEAEKREGVKTASSDVVNALYQKYFGGQE